MTFDLFLVLANLFAIKDHVDNPGQTAMPPAQDHVENPSNTPLK